MQPRADVRLVLRKSFGRPAAQGFSLPLVAQKQWEALQDKSNVWRVDIKQQAGEPRTDGLGLSFRYGTLDCGLSSCMPVIRADELPAVQAVTAILATEIATLQAKATPSADDLLRVEELTQRQADLTAGSFWREARNSFGDGCIGVYRATSAQNVPSEILTADYLEEDRPFTLWLHRAKPVEGQVSPRMIVDFGGHWQLVFEGDKSCKLRRLTTGLSAADRAAYEAELLAIEDMGRLTATDQMQLKTWKDEIDTEKATASKAGRKGSKKLLPEETLYIAQRKVWSKELRASKKGLPDARQRRLKELQELLYEDEAEVQLYNNNNTLWDQDVVLTFVPQARGFLTVFNNFGANYWTYEDKLITKTKEYGTILERAPIRIRHNGGAYWWKWSHVNVESSGYVLSGVCCLARPITNWAPTFSVDGAFTTGCDADFSAELLDAQRGTFQWRIDLTSDGDFIPFIYTCTMELAAEARNAALETVVLDTATLREDILIDAQPKFDSTYRGRGYTFVLRNEDGYLAELLPYWDGLQVEVWEGKTKVFTGVLHDMDEALLNKHVARVQMTATDRWDLVNDDQVAYDIFGNGKQLGTHLAEVLTGRGFLPSELRIASTPNLVLPSAGVGEEPTIQGKSGDNRGSYVKDLLDKYALGLEAYFDEDGVFVLEAKNSQTSDIHFVLSHAEVHSSTDIAIKGLQSRITKTDFYNYFRVIGDRKPESKKLRYTAVYVDWASIRGDHHDPRFLENLKPYKDVKDDAFNTSKIVNLVLRRTVEQYNDPLHEYQFECDYSPLFKVGLVCTMLGGSVKITAISSRERRTGRVQVTVKVLNQ